MNRIETLVYWGMCGSIILSGVCLSIPFIHVPLPSLFRYLCLQITPIVMIISFLLIWSLAIRMLVHAFRCNLDTKWVWCLIFLAYMPLAVILYRRRILLRSQSGSQPGEWDGMRTDALARPATFQPLPHPRVLEDHLYLGGCFRVRAFYTVLSVGRSWDVRGLHECGHLVLCDDGVDELNHYFLVVTV